MMRKGLALGVALVALSVLLWATGGVVAGLPPEGPEGDVTIAATVSSKISYQGVLKENGSPVTGSRDMTFRLYSDSGCTTQVGSDIVKSGVPVTNGLFSVDLAVTHSHFNGQGLWLEVVVGGTKIGCQEILPVPYALSLRPGAVISDTTTYVEVNRFAGLVYFGKFGVYAKAEGTATNTTYYGVYGRGTDYGVYGSGKDAAIYGDGDVKQSLTGDGLVKAAAYTYCGTCMLCSPYRSFNNVNDTAIGCVCGSSAGRCAINFGFDISKRFWVATSTRSDRDRGVTCWLGSANYELQCLHFDSSEGTGADGDIMVLLY